LPGARRPKAVDDRLCWIVDQDFIKNLSIGVDGGWWVGNRKTKDNQMVKRWLLARSTYLWG
jgi:hypothetical protein